MARILLIACLFAYGNVVACCSVSEGADAGAREVLRSAVLSKPSMHIIRNYLEGYLSNSCTRKGPIVRETPLRTLLKLKMSRIEKRMHSFIKRQLSPKHEVHSIKKALNYPSGVSTISILSGNGFFRRSYSVKTGKGDNVFCSLNTILGIWIVESAFFIEFESGYKILHLN
jgi:hypothetical protein